MFTFPRYYVITIILILLINSKSKGQLNIDHGFHAMTGLTIGLFTANLDKKPFKMTVLASAGIGIGKELIDLRNGKRFDHTDAAMTVLGGLVGYGIIKLLNKVNEKHRYRSFNPHPLNGVFPDNYKVRHRTGKF